MDVFKSPNERFILAEDSSKSTYSVLLLIIGREMKAAGRESGKWALQAWLG